MADFPFDAVLFDCDGVLVDSEPITNRVLAEMLGELGWQLSVAEAMHIFTGKTVRDEAAQIEARTGKPVTAEWLAQFRVRRNAALDSDLLEIPGAPLAVRTLHERLDGKIALASGADRHKIGMQLTRIGLADCFDGRVFSGQETPRNKPHPDVYLAAAHALGVDPARCAVIEDTATGAAAGRAAGATVFGYSPVEPGRCGPSALREAGAAQVFDDMSRLPQLLAQWSGATRTIS
jgi:HAD superfamily hydrolase (TIGR01509 family)